MEHHRWVGWNPDASLFLVRHHAGPADQRIACAVVVASAWFARRGPGDRRARFGSAGPPGFARSCALRLNTARSNRFDLGRMGCTAAPGGGNARTRTDGQDDRPSARSSGHNPRESRARTLAGVTQRWTNPHAYATLATHPPSSAWCWARRGSKLPGWMKPLSCPPTTQGTLTVLRLSMRCCPISASRRPVLIRHRRLERPRRRPFALVMESALQGGFHDQLVFKCSSSTTQCRAGKNQAATPHAHISAVLGAR